MLGQAEWLVGDHHVQSRFSATYKPDPSDPDASLSRRSEATGRTPLARRPAGVWGRHEAESLRDWRDAAPRVIIGMKARRATRRPA